MRKLVNAFALCAVLILSACDLQPKITSLPDSVGDFISDRYPALLADPETQPEIYNSAAADYGVYSSPDMYGSGGVDDYIQYSDRDDYTLKPEQQKATAPVSRPESKKTPEVVSEPDDFLVVPIYAAPVLDTMEITVGPGDTLYSISRKYALPVNDLAVMNRIAPPFTLSVGQKLKVPKGVVAAPVSTVRPTVPSQPLPVVAVPVKKEIIDVTVVKGDTVYSLARKYDMTVNDFAKLNKLKSPYSLSVGQKLKVHKQAPIKPSAVQTPVNVKPPMAIKPTQPPVVTPVPAKPVTVKPTPPKVSSAPTQPLPKISARSSTKFSWPVRGRILSGYGTKSNGLINDGINIAAAKGTTVSAAENGVVAYAGNELKGLGNLVIIQHSDGWMTVYSHMDTLSVRRGVRVTVGQKIGSVGQTGRVDRPQLHFEIRKGTKAYDPSSYLKK